MVKFVGVATLWVCLISLPHVAGTPGDTTSVAASPTPAAVADDPGDPFRLAMMPPPVGHKAANGGSGRSYDGSGGPESEAPDDEGAVPPEEKTKAEEKSPKKTSFAAIHFKNELGKPIALVEARFVLDGKELPVVTNLKPDAEVILFSGQLSPGPHICRAHVVMKGNRRGPVTYLEDYDYTMASDAVLTVPEGRGVVFRLAAHRNKKMNTPFERQLEITARADTMPGEVSVLRN